MRNRCTRAGDSAPNDTRGEGIRTAGQSAVVVTGIRKRGPPPAHAKERHSLLSPRDQRGGCHQEECSLGLPGTSHCCGRSWTWA